VKYISVVVCSSEDDDDKFTSTRTSKHPPAATLSPSPSPQSNAKKTETKEDIYEWKRNKLHTEEENYRQQLVNFHTLEKEYAKQNQNLEKYYQQAIKLVETGEFKEAIHHLQQAAQKNHAKSLFELGRIYEVQIQYQYIIDQMS
jgi:tetratricopeptide (TPR) repeat protein